MGEHAYLQVQTIVLSIPTALVIWPSTVSTAQEIKLPCLLLGYTDLVNQQHRCHFSPVKDVGY